MTTQYDSTSYNAAKQRLHQLHAHKKNAASTAAEPSAPCTADSDVLAEHKENIPDNIPSTTALQSVLQSLDEQYTTLQSTVDELMNKYGLAYTAHMKLQPVYDKLKQLYTTSLNTAYDAHTIALNEVSVQQSLHNATKADHNNKLKQLQSQHNIALKRAETAADRKYAERMQTLEKSSKRAADAREHMKRELRVELEQQMHTEYNESITSKIHELRDSAGTMLQQKQSEITQLQQSLSAEQQDKAVLAQQHTELRQQHERVVRQCQTDQKLIEHQQKVQQQHNDSIQQLQRQLSDQQAQHQAECNGLSITVAQLQRKLTAADKQHTAELHAINTKVQTILAKKDSQLAGVQAQLQQSIEQNRALQQQLEEAKQELNSLL